MITSSASSDALRVAMVCGSATSFAFSPSMAGPSAGATVARDAPLELGARSGIERLQPACQSLCAPAERAAALRQASSTSCGTEKGSAERPSAAFAPASSSAPSGSPCAFEVPARLGAPKPMMVLHAISDGLSDA